MKLFTKTIVLAFFFIASLISQELIAQSKTKVEFAKGNSNDLNNITVVENKTTEKSTIDMNKISKKVASYQSINNVKQRKRLRFRSKRKAAGKCYKATVCTKGKKGRK